MKLHTTVLLKNRQDPGELSIYGMFEVKKTKFKLFNDFWISYQGILQQDSWPSKNLVFTFVSWFTVLRETA